MKRTKVLFVVGDFCRGGAERFTYEVDRALNKEIFEISIFCLNRESQVMAGWSDRYYDSKHLELGSHLTYADKFRNFGENKPTLLKRAIRKIIPKKPASNQNLYKYFDSFDVIHWMGEYTFIQSVPDIIRKKSIIQTMSAKFQNRAIYDSYNHELYYNFCSFFNEDEISYELSQFEDYHYIIVPLMLKIEQRANQWKHEESKIKKIGIFTRLSKAKPLDPFFYAFQLLLDRCPNCELHIFGNGDPTTEQMTDALERLGIKDKVFFRGHQQDIVQTALNENLNLSWFQGYNNDRPAGYAGVDICTTGLPLICWDFHPNPKNKENSVYPHFKNLNQFVSFSLSILTNKDKAERLSNLQFTETIKRNDIKKNIFIIENEYLRIAELKN